MALTSVKIDGMAHTRALIQAVARAEAEAAREIVKKAAGDVQAAAMRIVPVDTGNLKRSIMVDIAPGGMSAEVTANADYAAYVEYGTRYKAARPYMQPAAQLVQAELNGGEAAGVAAKRLEEAKARLPG